MARSFALLGLLLVALTAHTVSGAATPKLTVDVLNFALNLEVRYNYWLSQSLKSRSWTGCEPDHDRMCTLVHHQIPARSSD